jgi:hypothetical protein
LRVHVGGDGLSGCLMRCGGIRPAALLRGCECPACEEQVGKRKQREDLCTVFGDAAVANLPIAELALHHPEHMLDLGADLTEPAITPALR